VNQLHHTASRFSGSGDVTPRSSEQGWMPSNAVHYVDSIKSRSASNLEHGWCGGEAVFRCTYWATNSTAWCTRGLHSLVFRVRRYSLRKFRFK